MRALFALLLVMVLAGCGSSPKTHYFSLDVVHTSGKTRTIDYPVQIAAVHIPAMLDRRQMVSGANGNAVSISSENRWSAALGMMTRRVLSGDLAAHLPKGRIVLPDAPVPAHTAQIVVAIERFGPDKNGHVSLDAGWTLLGAKAGKPVLRRDIRLRSPSAVTGPGPAAAAMSRLLGKFAVRIASALPTKPANEGGIAERSASSSSRETR